jgi:hypothetical protein
MPDFYTGLIALIEDLRQKDTSPAFASDTDSLEAIRERIDALAGATWSTQTLEAIKAAVDLRAAEATLTAMKGAGWSTETLKAIYDHIVALKGGGWTDETLVAILAGIEALSSNTGGMQSVVASDTLIKSHDAVASTSKTAYTKIKETLVLCSGIIRVKFDLYSGPSGTAYGRVYINDIAVGTERPRASESPATYSEDFPITSSDRVQIYAKHSTGASYAAVENFRFYGTLSSNFANIL